MDEKNPMGKADIKVDPEEFCDPNDDQANYDGMKLIIICSSTVLMLYLFYCCFYDLFQEYIFIPIRYRFLYSPTFDILFLRRRNYLSL